ncbi:ESX-1 secretion-associated protein [Mycobacterium simiae]|uniref:ESX-1 secretion-associated protein n=2 Tax=Mycobacterium simiae TaxID=1784 RepID=A0A5B1BVN3_MYCSI|nr:ESX-1 secretion-associated protein [Mycobacterium simiae]
MANLALTPGHLDNLAGKQDRAAEMTAEAATAANGIPTAVWVTHGVISSSSNIRFVEAEAARRMAAENMRKVAADLAAKLRTAKETYASVDEELSRNIDKQMISR